jgi:hypothetical protein
MRTKKIRLGLAMAALSVVVGGAVVAATEAPAWAGSSETGAVMDIPAKAAAPASAEEAASLAGFDWN